MTWASSIRIQFGSDAVEAPIELTVVDTKSISFFSRPKAEF